MKLHPYVKFSLIDELKPSRWGASHLPNKTVPGWRGILEGMLHCWQSGQETVLETVFFEYFDGRDVRGGPAVYKGRARPEN